MAGGERAERDPDARVIESKQGAHDPTGVLVDGYLVPVDPMDDLQCDSCQ